MLDYQHALLSGKILRYGTICSLVTIGCLFLVEVGMGGQNGIDKNTFNCLLFRPPSSSTLSFMKNCLFARCMSANFLNKHFLGCFLNIFVEWNYDNAPLLFIPRVRDAYYISLLCSLSVLYLAYKDLFMPFFKLSTDAFSLGSEMR